LKWGDGTLSRKQLAAIHAGTQKFWVFGMITYDDTFGKKNSMKFRGSYGGDKDVRMNALFWERESNESD
jgi:hypothetical protein